MGKNVLIAIVLLALGSLLARTVTSWQRERDFHSCQQELKALAYALADCSDYHHHMSH